MKKVVWLGSSLKEMRTFPTPVRRDMGQAIYTAQKGEVDPAAKPLKGFTGCAVFEISDRHDSDTYRTMYTARFGDTIYILHACKKKSKKGIALPQREKNLIRSRYEEAQLLHSGGQEDE